MRRHLAFVALTLVSTFASAQVIDFETKPDGSTPADNEPLSINPDGRYTIEGISVRFGLDTNDNGVIDTPANFERVGADPINGFVLCNGSPDAADASFAGQLGSFFLRAGGLGQTSVPDFIIELDPPVTDFSGEIWDLDGFEGLSEQWRVRAVDSLGFTIDSVVSPGPTDSCSGPDDDYDGEPWTFSFLGQTDVARIVIEFTGTKDPDGVGLAFNNFRPVSPAEPPFVLCTEFRDENGFRAIAGPIGQVYIGFSEKVRVPTGAIEVRDAMSNTPIPFAQSIDRDQLVLLTFNPLIPEGRYTLLIDDSVVSLANSVPLDGNDNGIAGGGFAEDFLVRCEADLTSTDDPMQQGYGVPNGVIDSADFFYYLDRFVEGCNP